MTNTQISISSRVIYFCSYSFFRNCRILFSFFFVLVFLFRIKIMKLFYRWRHFEGYFRIRNFQTKTRVFKGELLNKKDHNFISFLSRNPRHVFSRFENVCRFDRLFLKKILQKSVLPQSVFVFYFCCCDF